MTTTNARIDTDSLSYQDLLDNPALLERLERQARAERAAVLDQYFLVPLASWFRRAARRAHEVGAPARLPQG